MRVAKDSCPSAALLEQKLTPLLGADTRLEVSADALERPGEERARVSDLGTRYVVEVDGLRRELLDETRDCLERARVAAVFIALNLRPPPKARAVAVAPEEPAQEASERLHMGVQLFGIAAYAGETGHGAPGAGAGFWLMHGHLRFGFTSALLVATRVDLAPSAGVSGSVDLMRVPLALTVTYVTKLGRFELGPMLGLDLDVLRLRGVDVLRPQTELRINPGVLVAADSHVRLSSALSMFLRLGLDAFPRAYALSVDPTGKLGHTPRLWLNAALGAEWRF